MKKSKQSRIEPPTEKPQASSVAEPPTKSVPPKSRRNLQYESALCVFLLALGGYSLTAARTVTLVDSGELILASSVLGVAHPPGTPLHTILGFLFSKLPIGSVAARLSLMSAFFAAAASALATLIAAECFRQLAESKSVAKGKLGGRKAPGAADEPVPAGFRQTVEEIILPLGLGLAVAFSRTLWFYASVAEVYSLNLALLAAVIWLVLLWRRAYLRDGAESPTAARSLWAAVTVYGLALGVHHVTILLTFPAFLAFVWMTAGKAFFRTRTFFIACAASVGAALLIYLYLPVAAWRGPLLNWGNPRDFEGFLRHVSGWQYQVNLFSGGSEVFIRETQFFFGLLWREYTPVGLILALAGLWTLWKRDRGCAALLSLIVLFDAAYSVNYEIAEDKDAYYLTTSLAVALALGAGAYAVLEWTRKKPPVLAAALGLAMLALPAVEFGLHRFECDKSRYLIARDYVENMLASVEPGGLLLTLDWQFYSPYLYLRHVENFRPDATVVDVNLLKRSWYVETYLRKVYPDMMRACSRETEAFLEDVRLFEADKPYDPKHIQERFTTLIEAMTKYHLNGRTAYMTLPMEPGVGGNYRWVPQGLTLRLVPEPQEEVAAKYPNAPELNLRGLIDGSVYLDEVVKEKVGPAYAQMLVNRGKFLTLAGRLDEATTQLTTALRLRPASDRAYEFLGDVYLLKGNQAAAAEAYQTALRLNPGNQDARRKLVGPPDGASGP